jgi:hypothetical protein
MRNILHIGILFVAFLAGIEACSLFRGTPRQSAITNPKVESDTPLRFIAAGSLLEPDYHIHWYQTRGSSDPEEITLYGDFRSAEVTRETFKSNATSNASKLIERGFKFDEKGRRIGERGVWVSKKVKAVRIFWTEGDIFWSVQAPTLELAREFEESEIVHSITMSNKGLQPTPR